MSSFTAADQKLYAEHARQLVEQTRGHGVLDLPAELLDQAIGSPHSQLGKIFAAEPAVDFAKRRVPDASRFQREEERMLSHLEGDGNSYIEEGAKLLPDGPQSDL